MVISFGEAYINGACCWGGRLSEPPLVSRWLPQVGCWQAICRHASAGSAGNLWLLEAEGAGLQLALVPYTNHNRAGYCLHNHGCLTCGAQKEKAAAAVAR